MTRDTYQLYPYDQIITVFPGDTPEVHAAMMAKHAADLRRSDNIPQHTTGNE